jgi:hypothetical protein
MFLGHPTDYWIELERRVVEGGLDSVIAELRSTREALWIAQGKLRAIEELLK